MKRNMLKNGIFGAVLITASLNYSFSSINERYSIVQQDVKTKEFTVYGNCGMCKKRIEKAALSIDGVQSAIWNVDSKVMSVKFDEQKLSSEGKSLDNVLMRIAKAGHDNEYYKSKDEAYNALPGCCQYKRPEENK